MQTKNVVLVAGAHGVSGRAAAEHWTRKAGTQVFGLSRRAAPLPPGVQGITADLLDRKSLEEKIGRIKGVTHIVFAAYRKAHGRGMSIAVYALCRRHFAADGI